MRATTLTEVEPAHESVLLQGSTSRDQGHLPHPLGQGTLATSAAPARQEVTAPVEEGWQREGVFNMQKDPNEKLMTTAAKLRAEFNGMEVNGCALWW